MYMWENLHKFFNPITYHPIDDFSPPLSLAYMHRSHATIDACSRCGNDSSRADCTFAARPVTKHYNLGTCSTCKSAFLWPHQAKTATYLRVSRPTWLLVFAHTHTHTGEHRQCTNYNNNNRKRKRKIMTCMSLRQCDFYICERVSGCVKNSALVCFVCSVRELCVLRHGHVHTNAHGLLLPEARRDADVALSAYDLCWTLHV